MHIELIKQITFYICYQSIHTFIFYSLSIHIFIISFIISFLLPLRNSYSSLLYSHIMNISFSIAMTFIAASIESKLSLKYDYHIIDTIAHYNHSPIESFAHLLTELDCSQLI